jgi:hypothetical protein
MQARSANLFIFPRRSFLRIGLSALWGCTMGRAGVLRSSHAAEAVAPRAKNVIQIFLTGGPSTIDMWDLKPRAAEAIRGEFKPIETSVPGIEICEHMPKFAKLMHLATIVRSVTHTIAEHTQGQVYMMTGNRPQPSVESPSLSALSAALLHSHRGTPVNMTVGTVPSSGAGDLGAVYNPFTVNLPESRMAQSARESLGLPDGFTTKDLERRRQVLERIDRQTDDLYPTVQARQSLQIQQDALEILQSNRIQSAMNLTEEAESVRNAYGNSFVGRGALAARRLVEAGARFVTIGFGDWDTHDNNFSRLRNGLLPQLDLALASLLDDLATRGMLDDTIVYCAGEFARTPNVNTNLGRDHWSRAMSVVLAGGGINAGRVHGATDETASDVTVAACSPDDISATLFHLLGFSPSHLVQTPSGRTTPLFRNGKVIEELI